MRSVPSDIADRLKYVTLPRNRRVNLRYFPDFIIVGPQRTGTTWLSENLGRHPQVFASQPKEIYYFNLLKNQGHKKFKSSDLTWYLKFFHDTPVSYVRKMAYALTKFRQPYLPEVRGEATASYAVVDRDIIEEIVTLNPRIKIILLIRNPIDRAWSHAKKDLAKRRRRPVSQVPDEEFRNFFADKYQRACADYAAMIRNWSEFLQPGHLFIGQFDDIRRAPVQMLQRVFSFLGVDSDPKYATQLASTVVNTTESSDIPHQYRELLQDLLKDEITSAQEMLGLSWETERTS